MMTRPYQHPKTRVYWLRKVVPEPLRAVVGKRELKETLGTKDPAEAKRKAPAVVERFEAMIASARSGNAAVSDRDIQAICGQWYRDRVASEGDNPGLAVNWEMEQAEIESLLDLGDPQWSDASLGADGRREAALLLERAGHLATPLAVARLGAALLQSRYAFAGMMERRANGDWAPDGVIETFPAPATKAAPAPPSVITFGDLVAGWAAECGTSGKALYDRERTAAGLKAFLGHDTAARVTADDVVRWKEARLAAGKSAKTVANDIGELRPIWKWGKLNRKLAFAENPFAGLAPRTKRGGPRLRVPFSEDDARALLTAARRQDAALLRWLPWVLCFTGARIAEACQSVKEDFTRQRDGTWVLHIHENGPGRKLKTLHSERRVPLHPALIAEGLMSYVGDLPDGSPLFPDVHPDVFGSRGGTATKNHGRWVRKAVKITDTAKDPAHAWRHRFEDEARHAGVPQTVTDGLMGHRNAQNESEGYGRGHRFMPDVSAPWVAKMRAPLAKLSLVAGDLPVAADQQGA